MNKTYEVKGMSCVICKNTVEKGIKNLNGVNDCLVNLMDNEATIDFDETKVTEQDFYNTLKELGYEFIINKRKEIDLSKTKLIISCALMAILLSISMTSMNNPIITMYYQLVLASLIYYINFNYFKSGFTALIHLSPNMDSLVAISSFVSYVYSIYSMFMLAKGIDQTHLYFESGSMVLVIVTIGKTIEARSKKKTTKAIRGLSTLIPMQANLIKDNEVIIIPIEELKKDDVVLVKAGESIPQDGIVIKGNSKVNESLITGESKLANKAEGSEVIGGTVNTNGELIVRITKQATQTVLSKIISLTKKATLSKIAIERFVDKVSNYFVFGVISVSLITFIIWLIISKDIELSLNFCLSVLVISCPCALGLATPSAITVACGKAAKEGILIKNPEVLEIAHSLKTIIIDKTGTITENKLTITDIKKYDDDLENIIVALEKKSNHPIAKTILNRFENSSLDLSVKEISGEGIVSNNYWAGNQILAKKYKTNINEDDLKYAIDNNYSFIIVGKANKVLGIIYLSDKIKSTSKIAINNLINKGLDVIMCTGDNEIIAKSVSEKIGIKSFLANVKPEDKQKIVKSSKEKGYVGMVGDGINDAIALSTSDVSFTPSNGTDIANASSDIVLMHNDINDINFFIDLSKITMKKIKGNLFWALFYNSVLIPIAAGILYPSLNIKLNPMIGALAMSISSIFVLINALSISNIKKEEILMNKTVIIEGMMCGHCQAKVEEVLKALGLDAKVSHEEGKAWINNTSTDNSIIKKAIEDVGFEVKDIIDD